MSRPIVKTPGVCGGEPCIAGTRMTVSALQAYHRRGDSVDQLKRMFPQLTKNEIRRALAYPRNDGSRPLAPKSLPNPLLKGF